MPKVVEAASKFKLDKFQEDAINHIKNGKSVIVCAPTGAGKTLIAKQAIRDAIEQGKKCFYTAPLKALINQKYSELCEEFGEKHVGILTGDTSKNRDAQVIVMTTEIYRNMLYGTTFGSLDPYLQDLKYLIFDEFHYINDPSRGTVWEESLIYSPHSVQVVALSATINNPLDLVEWIRDIHGECELVETNERPVPLHHFYFKDAQLTPLLTPNGKLNPKLKERSDNRFSKKGNKFNNRNNSSKEASSPKVIQELFSKGMLPAIFFVFSRKGCDSAAQQCAHLQLLSAEESKQLSKLIDEAIQLDSHKHIKNHPQLDLLRKGIASHHAGLLPQWKALIEDLFLQGYIKVVFSTETLAAGINMPARSTVISSISKISDDGHRLLRPSEFMQMSGRAGRRGMDEAGYVITIKNNYQTAGEAALLASSKPEDIESHFSSSYEMVLNLLQNHKLDEIKNLLSKSFGQALADKTLQPLKNELLRLERGVKEQQSPLCPGEIGDLNYYKNLQAKLDEIRLKKKQLEKQMSEGVDELEEHLQMLTSEAQHYPCNGCPKQKPCSKQMVKVKRYRKQIKELEQLIKQRESIYWENFEKIVELLKEKNYLDKDFNPTEIGKICASIRADNSFLITEILCSGILEKLQPSEFPAVLSALVISDSRSRNAVFEHSSKNVFNSFEQIHQVTRKVIQSQRQHRIDKSTDVIAHMAPLIEKWAQGLEWEELMRGTTLDDGDVLKGIRRTLDMVKQVVRAPGLNPKLQALAKESAALLERAPILELV
jgi:superfamily II RNA helicase